MHINLNPIEKITRCQIKSKRQFSKTLKKNRTPAEVEFAKLFQSWKARGFIPKCSMRGQRVINPYIVDFSINDFKVFIELDGSVHNDRGLYDFQRDSFIYKETGFTAVRFPNQFVFNNHEAIILKLNEVFSFFKSHGYQLPPDPEKYAY